MCPEYFVLSCFPFVISLLYHEWFKARCSMRADIAQLQVLQPYRFILPNGRRKLHRASIVYEFEKYRQKTVEYRTKYGLKFGCRDLYWPFMDLLGHAHFHLTHNWVRPSAELPGSGNIQP